MAKISIAPADLTVYVDNKPVKFTEEEFGKLAIPPAVHAVAYDEDAASGHIEWQGPTPNTQLTRSMFEGMFRHAVEAHAHKGALVDADKAAKKAELLRDEAGKGQATPAATNRKRKPTA